MLCLVKADLTVLNNALAMWQKEALSLCLADSNPQGLFDMHTHS